ncbi:voltage-dependent calcium channel gamma-1 subunit [Periplaneta americana]|uniref:voltage-dependent calcium channel gamma-1 subunit n=1 Tax=Periplaneta americana TaxID=6978 RepID=UPI0037E7623C
MGNKREKKLNKKLMFERRVLFLCTAMVGLSIVLWIVAVSTDWWFVVSGEPNGIYVNETKRYFLKSNSGLWRICRTSFTNLTAATAANATNITAMGTGDATVNTTSKIIIFRFCRSHEMFPGDVKIRADPAIDRNILNYNRSETSFSIISLLLMIMGFIFSFYTFRNPRYMFKRLAGGIHFLACACVLAVIEVLISSIDYEQKHLPFTFPKGATYSYGFSFVFAWLVFIMLLVSGCSFMIYSRKRKGNKAPNEEIAMADEPTIIGR